MPRLRLGGARRLPGASGLRAACAVLVGALVAVAALVPAAAPASATTYRYWSYWHGSGGGWSFASTGPGGYRPADGSVEGWRFAVSSQGGGAAPRVAPSFQQVCGSTPAQDGMKRVAVVIDDGVQADANPGDRVPANSPRGICAQVSPTATGARVLSAAAAVGSNDSGLVCSIDGYPSAGCGEVVTAPKPAPSPSAHPTSGGSAGSPRVSTSSASPPRAAGSARSTSAASVRASATTAAPGTTSQSSSTSASSSRPTASASAGTPASTPAATASSATAAGASPDASPTPTLILGRAEPVSHSSGVPVGFIVGLVLVGLLGAGAVLRARRGGGE